MAIDHRMETHAEAARDRPDKQDAMLTALAAIRRERLYPSPA
ncbi:hypothetical protein M2352_004177 [Azospirillum fermentarium]|nr:hypothetical protein [Azospirillum fermentarium]MCW2248517.1 hypothetical protein [Azospirillum fermentarium]